MRISVKGIDRRPYHLRTEDIKAFVPCISPTGAIATAILVGHDSFVITGGPPNDVMAMIDQVIKADEPAEDDSPQVEKVTTDDTGHDATAGNAG